jgi:HK97 gp10 family phage protein
MAVENGFDFSAMDNIMKALEGMGKTIDGTLKDKALKAGAEVLKEKVESHPNMPVSSEPKQHARDNIGIKKVSDDQYDIGATNEFFYLLFHEIGAQGGLYMGIDDQVYVTPDIQAKPFMRPALENNQPEIQKAMAKVIKRGMGL